MQVGAGAGWGWSRFERVYAGWGDRGCRFDWVQVVMDAVCIRYRFLWVWVLMSTN